MLSASGTAHSLTVGAVCGKVALARKLRHATQIANRTKVTAGDRVSPNGEFAAFSRIGSGIAEILHLLSSVAQRLNARYSHRACTHSVLLETASKSHGNRVKAALSKPCSRKRNAVVASMKATMGIHRHVGSG